MNHHEKIKIINKAISDTKFLLDKPFFTVGLKRCIKRWLISIILLNLILFLFDILLQTLTIFESNTIYHVHNILFIMLNIIPLCIYLIFISEKNLSLKEKHFLRLFFIIPILFFLNKILFPLAFYLNFDYLLSLYDSISLELFATIIATLLLYYFFKNIKYLYLTFVTLIYTVVSSVIKIIYLNSEQVNYALLKLFNFNDFINNYSIFSILIFLFVIYFISKEQNEPQYIEYI